MTKLLLSATALTALSFSALAADLPKRDAAPLAPVAVFTWTGFYMGGQAGVSQIRNLFSDIDRTVGADVDDVARKTGTGGGVHAGFNHQHGAYVFGVEADVEASSLRYGFTSSQGWGYRAKLGVQGSLRARVGYAFDRTLVYATGGLAAGNASVTYFYLVPETFSNTRIGWTLGSGVEYAVSTHWTARLEYRYTALAKASNSPVLAWTQYRDEQSASLQTARVGVSYKF